MWLLCQGKNGFLTAKLLAATWFWGDRSVFGELKQRKCDRGIGFVTINWRWLAIVVTAGPSFTVHLHFSPVFFLWLQT